MQQDREWPNRFFFFYLQPASFYMMCFYIFHTIPLRMMDCSQGINRQKVYFSLLGIIHWLNKHLLSNWEETIVTDRVLMLATTSWVTHLMFLFCVCVFCLALLAWTVGCCCPEVSGFSRRCHRPPGVPSRSCFIFQPFFDCLFLGLQHRPTSYLFPAPGPFYLLHVVVCHVSHKNPARQHWNWYNLFSFWVISAGVWSQPVCVFQSVCVPQTASELTSVCYLISEWVMVLFLALGTPVFSVTKSVFWSLWAPFLNGLW